MSLQPLRAPEPSQNVHTKARMNVEGRCTMASHIDSLYRNLETHLAKYPAGVSRPNLNSLSLVFFAAVVPLLDPLSL